MIVGLAHVCFTVSNLDEAIAFYEKLGLRIAFGFLRESGERFGVYLHVGGRSFLELFTGQLQDRADGQSYRHICLEVDNIQATVADLRRQAIDVSDVKMGDDRSYQAWLTDPDGNRIELHQYTPESWQSPSLG